MAQNSGHTDGENTAVYQCEDCGDEVREPNADGSWNCTICGGEMKPKSESGVDWDAIDHGKDIPKKTCEYEEDYGGRPCTNVAEQAVFARVNARVNEHGVHISTEVRPIFVCEEHTHVGEGVPPKGAKVVTRRS